MLLKFLKNMARLNLRKRNYKQDKEIPSLRILTLNKVVFPNLDASKFMEYYLCTSVLDFT